MDIIYKLPDDIANKIYLMIGEHPCARMITELKNKYQFDDDFNIFDEHFKHDRLFYDETRTSFCDNYNLFAITHFTMRLINFDVFKEYLPEPERKDFSNIYSINQTKELFTIITPSRNKILRIVFKSEFERHRIYHHICGHSYFEFDDYDEIYEEGENDDFDYDDED